jgi:hypothetical protein
VPGVDQQPRPSGAGVGDADDTEGSADRRDRAERAELHRHGGTHLGNDGGGPLHDGRRLRGERVAEDREHPLGTHDAGGVGERLRRPDGLTLVVADHQGEHLVTADLRVVVELSHIRAGPVRKRAEGREPGGSGCHQKLRGGGPAPVGA